MSMDSVSSGEAFIRPEVEPPAAWIVRDGDKCEKEYDPNRSFPGHCLGRPSRVRQTVKTPVPTATAGDRAYVSSARLPMQTTDSACETARSSAALSPD